MKLIPTTVTLVTLTVSLFAVAVTRATAQSMPDEIITVRNAVKVDRKVVIAEGLQLTEKEGEKFWPLYRTYRADMDKCGDGILKLVLEYADLYPDVPDERAKSLLKEYTALEEKIASKRAWYLKKFAKVIPAAKAMRFAQLENRLDLTLRVQMANSIPLVPFKVKQ